jgi:hypothetical protein
MMHADPMYVALQLVHDDQPAEKQQMRVRRECANNRTAWARGLMWLQRLRVSSRGDAIPISQAASSAGTRTV